VSFERLASATYERKRSAETKASFTSMTKIKKMFISRRVDGEGMDASSGSRIINDNQPQDRLDKE
jgi:hypothetical protein